MEGQLDRWRGPMCLLLWLRATQGLSPIWKQKFLIDKIRLIENMVAALNPAIGVACPCLTLHLSRPFQATAMYALGYTAKKV